jgi:hypothetical protein
MQFIKVKSVPTIIELRIPRKDKFSFPRLAIQFRFDTMEMQVWPYGERCQYLPMNGIMQALINKGNTDKLKSYLLENGISETVFQS